MTPTQKAAANGEITPAEEDLPNMISVDDHVMEPKELWQQQLPASLRERGPRTVREKVKLSFKGGHYGFEPNAWAATAGVANAALANLVRQLSWGYGPRGVTSHGGRLAWPRVLPLLQRQEEGRRVHTTAHTRRRN